MTLSIERLAVAVPFFYYNAGQIVMNVEYVDYLVDDATPYNTQFQELRNLALANQQNPDWKWLSEAGTDVTYTLEQGDNSAQIHGLPLLSAELDLTVEPTAKIDKWYGASSFGIYGVANWGTGEGPAAPALFINSPAQILHPPDNYYSKLFITLKPGVRGSVVVTPIAPYPYILVGTYPSGDPAFWAPFEFPPNLGMQPGTAYPCLYPPP